jgi:histidine triad (HIT) family protein
MTDCLFCKIVAGDINSDIIYQDDDVLAFRDVSPQAPTHVLIIPKRHISTINDLQKSDQELVGKLYLTAKLMAEKEGIAEQGYRAVINCNAHGGQSVFHLHLHLLGGRQLEWPPG